MQQTKQKTRIASMLTVAVLCMLMVVIGSLGARADRAYAAENTLEAQAATSNVRYIGLFGADTWHYSDGSLQPPASDMTAVLRVDTASGTINMLTIPRDVKYDNMASIYPDFTNYKTNMAFRYAFNQTYNEAEDNYEEAIRAAATAECKVVSEHTGISISDYVVVDLITYQDVIDKIGGIAVDIPVGIKDYRLYSNKQYYSVNDGKTGMFTLDGWDAMIAARAREPYCKWTADAGYNIKFASLNDYKGNYPQLIIRKVNANGTPEYWYHFDGDGTREYLNRRVFAALVNKGLDVSGGAASFVWNQLIAQKLIWTSLAQDDVVQLGNALTKAKREKKLAFYGASMVSPVSGASYDLKGEYQYLIVLTASDKAMKDAVLKQFKAGQPMDAGWASETIIDLRGIKVGEKRALGGITYQATSGSEVAVVAVPKKTSISIPATVVIQNKQYKVTTIGKKAFAAAKKKVKKVTIGNNVTTIGTSALAGCTKLSKVKGGASVEVVGTSAFSGCKKLKSCAPVSSVKLTKIGKKAFNKTAIKKLVVKSTLLTKKSVKGSLKGSKVKRVTVSVKSGKKKLVKKYRKYFTRANTGCVRSLKVA